MNIEFKSKDQRTFRSLSQFTFVDHLLEIIPLLLRRRRRRSPWILSRINFYRPIKMTLKVQHSKDHPKRLWLQFRGLLKKRRRSLSLLRLLSRLNWLLHDSRWIINRRSTHNSSFIRLKSLRRLGLLCLFFNRPLNWSLNNIYLFRWLLLCSTIWVILIDHWRLIWQGNLWLLHLLLLGDVGLVSRRGSKEMYGLVNHVAYWSNTLISITIYIFAGLPVLEITGQHDAPVRCLWLL